MEQNEEVDPRLAIIEEAQAQQARDELGRFAAKEEEEPAEAVEAEKLKAPEKEIEPAPKGDEPEIAPVKEPEPKPEPHVDGDLRSLPIPLREKWGELPEATRDIVLSSMREKDAKIASMGRIQQAIQPIFETVQRAAAELPQLAGMTPADVARDVFELARVQDMLRKDPVETIAMIAQRYGATEALAARFAGQEVPPTASLAQKLAETERRLAEVSDPNRLYQQFDQYSAQKQVLTEVNSFAETHPHYAAVENVLPDFIQTVMKVSPGGSPLDTLGTAYELACRALGLQEATPAQAPLPVAAPARTDLANKARSANAPAASAGKTVALSLDEERRQILAKAGISY